MNIHKNGYYVDGRGVILTMTSMTLKDGHVHAYDFVHYGEAVLFSEIYLDYRLSFLERLSTSFSHAMQKVVLSLKYLWTHSITI